VPLEIAGRRRSSPTAHHQRSAYVPGYLTIWIPGYLNVCFAMRRNSGITPFHKWRGSIAAGAARGSCLAIMYGGGLQLARAVQRALSDIF